MKLRRQTELEKTVNEIVRLIDDQISRPTRELLKICDFIKRLRFNSEAAEANAVEQLRPLIPNLQMRQKATDELLRGYAELKAHLTVEAGKES